MISLDVVTSTNSWAREHATEFHPEQITCIAAREQTAGRGRYGRGWLSPRDLNLYLTFYHGVPKGISTTFRDAVAQGCLDLLLGHGIQASLKHPNDVMVEGKKMGGILTETHALDGTREGVIVGLGLNVNMPQALLSQISQPATSMTELLNQHLDPVSLIEPLIHLVIQRYAVSAAR